MGFLLKKRLLCSILSIVLLLTLLCSCSKTADSVVLPIYSKFKSLDPQISASTDTASIINNCMEGLVRVNGSGDIEPAAAKEWEISPDGLTYTFHLRDGLKWHLTNSMSGILGKDYKKTFNTAITAGDFVFALQRGISRTTASPYASLLLCIENAQEIQNGTLSASALGVEAPDSKTLVVHLAAPDVNFLSVMAQPIAMPCSREFFRCAEGRYGLGVGLLPSNGPYFLSALNSETGTVTLDSNPDYNTDTYTAFEKRPSTVTFVLTEAAGGSEDTSLIDPADSINADKNGLDAAEIPASALDSLTAKAKVNTYDNSIKTLVFRQKSAFAKNKYMRLATVYATDPASIEKITGGSPAKGIVPDCCMAESGTYYRSSAGKAELPAFNMKKAQKYYKKQLELDAEEAAMSGENEEDIQPKEYSITLICLESDRAAAQALIQNWQKLYRTSVAITVKTYASQTSLDLALSGNGYDAALTTVKADNCIAPTFLQSFTTGSPRNHTGIAESQYDAYVNAAQHSSTVTDVCQNCILAENTLLKRGLILPLRAVSTNLAVKSTADGLYVSPAGSVFSAFAIGS